MGTEVKREFTPERLKELERQGLTMKGGGFPIETVGDLENAIRAIGRARDPEATKTWIMKRARELHREDLIPEGWETGPDDDADDDESKAWYDETTIDHKVVPVSGFKVLDDATGIVEAIVSVTGIEDRVKDTIEPGAYTKTLEERIPRGCWGHDWLVPISKTIAIKELLPGDQDLPKTLRNGKAWPANAGALMVQTQFNLETQRGREAYSDVKFFGQDQEWSIGYNVPPGGATVDPKTGRRSIKQLVLHEYSPVLHGAMPEAVTQSVKSAQAAYADMIERIEGSLDEEKRVPLDEARAAAAAKPAPTAKPAAKPASGGSAQGTTDASGHVHVASGPKGGQFAPKVGGGSGGSTSGSASKGKHRRAVAAHAAAGGATHTVKKGDTLWAIAAKMLGSGTRWKEIAAANGIKDPRKVPIGMVLKIPGNAAPAPAAAKPTGHLTRVGTAPGNAAQMAAKIRSAAKVKDDGSAVIEVADLDALVQALDNPPIDSDVLLADVDDTLTDALDYVEADDMLAADVADLPDLDLADFVPADTEDVDDPDDEPEPDDEVAGEDYPVDDVVTEPDLSDEDLALLFADVELDEKILGFEPKADTHPGNGNRGNAETLRRYWSTGLGAAKIRWGTEGDFDRCVTHVSKYMTPEQAKGYCNLLHHRSIGIWPAQHAALVHAAGGKDAKDVTGGSYALGIEPGLAGADGRPKIVDVAVKPGEPCPECGQDTDGQGHCMNPDCERFGMGVKVAKVVCDHTLDENGECDVPGCPNANEDAMKAAMLGAVKSLLHDGLITPADLGLKAAKPVETETDDDLPDDEPDGDAENPESEPADPDDGEDIDDDTGAEKNPEDEQEPDDQDAEDKPKGKADITLDAMRAAVFFEDAEEKGYIRKQPHGGWIWAGKPGTPDTRGRSTHADMAALGGGIAPEGWVPGEATRINHDAVRAVRFGRTGAMDEPRPKAPKGTFDEGAPKAPRTPTVHSALKVTQPLDHPDGGRLTRDGHTFHVQNRSTGALERWKVSHPQSGHSTEVDGPGSSVPVAQRGHARLQALSSAVHHLLGLINGSGGEPQKEPLSRPGQKRRASAQGQLEHAQRVVAGHATAPTAREGRQASANVALARTMRPPSQMAEADLAAEVDSLRTRLRTEKPAPGSLRSNLVRSRIATLLAESRKRQGKSDDNGYVLDEAEFKATEVAAQERARTVAIMPAWADLATIPPMGEYDRWDEGQLLQAYDALVETLNADVDIPEEFRAALQVELAHVIAQQNAEETPVEKADSTDLSGMSMEAIGQEAGQILQRLSKDGGSDADKARLRALNAERKRRSKSLGVLDEAMETETADVLTMQEVLEAERLLADLD